MATSEDTYPQGLAWDEAKRRRDLAKHGIDFIDAGRVFKGRVAKTSAPRRGDLGHWGLVIGYRHAGR